LAKELLEVVALGQPAPTRSGLAEWLSAGRPVNGSAGERFLVNTPRREYRLRDPLGYGAAIRDLLVRPAADVAVLVVPGDTGLRLGTPLQFRLARLAGIERFILFIEPPTRPEDPAWLDLIEADARELLAHAGVPADDVPAVSSAAGLLAALDAITVPPPPRTPVRLTITSATRSPLAAGLWRTGVRVERGRWQPGDPMELLPTGSTVSLHSASDFGFGPDPAGPLVQAGRGDELEAGMTLATPGIVTATTRCEAFVRLRSAREGGRTLGVRRGYMPQFARPDCPDQAARMTDFRRPSGRDVEACEPGEVVLAVLHFLWPACLEPGDAFELREGWRAVADGRVTAVG
jgi:elongation factor Tu